jgi:FkbM family methyltransferase
VGRVTDAAATARIEAVRRRLHHYDPWQLAFQLAEIAGAQTYLRHGVELREGAVVLDVGANVGVAAVYFATECGASAVHSFEPVAPLFALLRENVAGLPACVAHPYGLGAAPATAPITFYRGAAAMSGLYADAERDSALVRTLLGNGGIEGDEADAQLAGRYEPEHLTCELRTLSGFLREQALDRVDLLKIDVERAELDVLAGIDDEDWPKLRQIVVEAHDEDGRAAAIATSLEQRGFDVVVDQDDIMRGTAVRMLYAVTASRPARAT